MQFNDIGQIALKYYQPGQILVQRTPSKTDYVFQTRANICMAWVNLEDVENILARNSRPCCGGHTKKIFSYANESDVRRWTNNGGQ